MKLTVTFKTAYGTRRRSFFTDANKDGTMYQILWTRDDDNKVKFNWYEKGSENRGYVFYQINYRDRQGVVHLKGTPQYIWTINCIEAS